MYIVLDSNIAVHTIISESQFKSYYRTMKNSRQEFYKYEDGKVYGVRVVNGEIVTSEIDEYETTGLDTNNVVLTYIINRGGDSTPIILTATSDYVDKLKDSLNKDAKCDEDEFKITVLYDKGYVSC